MEELAWFADQLRSSADGVRWALAQIPLERHGRCPPAPHYLGGWPPARHLWHLLCYERCLVVPSMRQWIDGRPAPREEDWPDDDAAWEAAWSAGVGALPAQFEAVREEQLELLAAVQPGDWQRLLPTVWGEKPLRMVVTKTYQHTLEHGDTLLRIGLWWDDAERDIAARRAAQAAQAEATS